MAINIIFADKKYSKLSNFGYKPFELNINHFIKGSEIESRGTKLKYKVDNVEQAFQAMKYFYCDEKYNEDNLTIFNSIMDCNDPITCKRLGRTFKGLEKQLWFKVSYNLMENLIGIAIYQNPEVEKLLLSTGDEPLIHNTGYREDRWTVDFPIILMELREDLRERHNSKLPS